MSNKQSIAYSMIHQYLLGRYPSVETYNDRIVAHKIGYLSQSVGIYIGDINFYWHKRGPYSRVLTSLLFSINSDRQNIEEMCQRFKITEELRPRLNKVKELIDSRPIGCKEVYWLEICASLKFISKEFSTRDTQVVKETLLKRKPFLNEYSNFIDNACALVL